MIARCFVHDEVEERDEDGDEEPCMVSWTTTETLLPKAYMLLFLLKSAKGRLGSSFLVTLTADGDKDGSSGGGRRSIFLFFFFSSPILVSLNFCSWAISLLKMKEDDVQRTLIVSLPCDKLKEFNKWFLRTSSVSSAGLLILHTGVGANTAIPFVVPKLH